MTCRLCTLDKELQNSHIIPEFLYKPLYDDKHRAQRLSKIGEQQEYKKRKLLQKGLREKLLCFDCEQLLNDRYEKYFKQLWFDEKALPSKFGADTEIKLNGLNYGKFKLFHLSILFRASVSSLPEFEQVTLGVHEKSLREMLIYELSDSDKKYPILCHALTKGNHEVQYGLITNPFKTRQPSGHTSYSFCFGGCVWCYIIDSREVASFSSFMLTSKGELGIMSTSWETFLNL
ncbi:MAG: hypothetical protein WCS87_01015 [Methylococcaceae bacterium]